MIDLFIDTSYKILCVGVLRNGCLIDKIQIVSEFNFSEKLIPIIDEMINKNNLKFSEINKIYVTVGPGSFTGIRIGVTVAKMMGFALNIGIIPLSSLEFMATAKVDTKYIIPIIDARHGYVFGAIYDNKGNNILEDIYIPYDELVNKIDDDVTYVSYDKFELQNLVLPDYDIEKIVFNHRNDKCLNCHEVKPNYLKKTEAEEKNDQRSQN